MGFSGEGLGDEGGFGFDGCHGLLGFIKGRHFGGPGLVDEVEMTIGASV